MIEAQTHTPPPVQRYPEEVSKQGQPSMLLVCLIASQEALFVGFSLAGIGWNKAQATEFWALSSANTCRDLL